MSRLIIKNAKIAANPSIIRDLFVENGKFVERFETAEQLAEIIDLQGQLVIPGLIETHIHLDKACILSRCQLSKGTLAEAIEQTSKAKAEFTYQDVYQRGAEVIEKAIKQGTTYMRTHVEIDPVIGLTGFEAILKLKQDYAWAITLEICVFPQEGMFNNPGTEALLIEAINKGADSLGGCPYTDSKPEQQIIRLFELATEFDLDLDFHLDFDLNPNEMLLTQVMQCATEFAWQHRVTVGHATKLSCLPTEKLQQLAVALAKSGVNVTSLPSTDMFLMGREAEYNKPRGVAPLLPLDKQGVTCSISTNNLGNPFTPYGDASLIRQANLYANIQQLATTDELIKCLSWVSTQSAKLLRLNQYGLSPGCDADFIVLNAQTPEQVIAEIKSPVCGFKRGIKTFERTEAQLLRA
ncbi:amidohydrolase family protein [Catenovulum sp. 2E275]|uniref:amidohydrolase family protein n=1 Tax=Catenovulum sp. 2E275 TaxID=2980497 RepID=UPI0021D1D7E5|nr:amidohydrolase family protein [Catenovulum sp. 2E275]MCU4677401.1 amidohydrolase family protein [Catenovulum sp. 2E275]